jgi:hypothetical protein
MEDTIAISVNKKSIFLELGLRYLMYDLKGYLEQYSTRKD